jgi:hypothetical protein
LNDFENHLSLDIVRLLPKNFASPFLKDIEVIPPISFDLISQITVNKLFIIKINKRWVEKK